MLGPAKVRATQCLQSRSVWVDQRQVEPWPRNQRDVGRICLAPAEPEEVTGFLDWDGFPPRPPLAVILGQHEMIDIDLVPILGQRFAIGDGICCDWFAVICMA
jgi:hypothetical protein